ncbi:MAG: hypothetical protein ABR502_06185 [Chitinophagaceae bacterium]|jgi:hypothetical protein
MKKFIIVIVVLFSVTCRGLAQEIDFENLDLRQILGKVLAVEKGYAPKFYVGKNKIPKIEILGEILNSKRNPEINRLFRTFKTGRTVYKIAAYSGAAISIYGVVKNAINNNKDSVSGSSKDAAMTALYSGAGTILSGVVVKLLTKGASYKAVDLFGGVIKRKLGEILGIDLGMTRQYNGMPGMTAGIKIAL